MKFEHTDIMEEISAKDLLRILKAVTTACPDAIVTIRQTSGTDFPPFIAIETPECHNKFDNEGAFTNLLK